MRYSFNLRLLASLLVMTLAVPQPLGFAMPVHRPRLPDGQAQTIDHRQNKNQNSSDYGPSTMGHGLSIPSDLGTIEEVYESPLGTHGSVRRTIFYIQDAHDSLEAQENIAKLIDYFVERHGVKTVFEEGYEGSVPSDEYFGFIKDPVVKEKVAYFLMDQLRIGGAEYAHINRGVSGKGYGVSSEKKQGSKLITDPLPLTSDFRLIGADSRKLHLENIRQYQRSARNKAKTDRDLKLLETEIEKLVNQYFPKDFKNWLKLKQKFEVHQLDVMEYVKRTLSLRGDRKVDEAISDLSADQAGIASLSRLGGIARNDKAILNAKILFEELAQLERDIAKKFLHSEREQKILEYYQGLKLVRRLNEIQITPTEFEGAKAQLQKLDTREMAKFIAKESKQSIALSSQWEESIRDSIRFYEISVERERAIEETLEQFAGERVSESAGQPVNPHTHIPAYSVLVFGGFHKDGIKEILKRNGYSYVIVSPKITKIDAKHQADYKRLMSAGPHYFGFSPASLPLSLTGRGLGEGMALQNSRLASMPFDIGRTPRGKALAQSELRVITQIVSENPNLEYSILNRKIMEALAKQQPSATMGRSLVAEKKKQSTIRSEMRMGMGFGLQLQVAQKLGMKQAHLLQQRLAQKLQLLLQLEPDHPPPGGGAVGLAALKTADEILKERRAVGFVIGSMSRSLWDSQTTEQTIERHHDLDVVVLNKDFRLKKKFEGGIDWWLPKTKKLIIRSDAATIEKTEDIWVNGNDIFVRAFFGYDVDYLPPGLYLPRPAFLKELTKSVVLSYLDPRVEIADDDVIEDFYVKLEAMFGSEPAEVWKNHFRGLEKILYSGHLSIKGQFDFETATAVSRHFTSLDDSPYRRLLASSPATTELIQEAKKNKQDPDVNLSVMRLRALGYSDKLIQRLLKQTTDLRHVATVLENGGDIEIGDDGRIGVIAKISTLDDGAKKPSTVRFIPAQRSEVRSQIPESVLLAEGILHRLDTEEMLDMDKVNQLTLLLLRQGSIDRRVIEEIRQSMKIIQPGSIYLRSFIQKIREISQIVIAYYIQSFSSQKLDLAQGVMRDVIEHIAHAHEIIGKIILCLKQTRKIF